jgi:hypothetical protein
MASATRDRLTQADLPVVLNGPACRRLHLRILFIHSDAKHVDDCVEELRRASFKVSADVVLTPEQFAGRLKSKSYDVVLAEYPSSKWQGSQALEILRLRDKKIPCIFLTSTLQLEILAELVTKGAADCVAMDHVGHLPVAISRALSENNLREERDQTEKKLRHSEARYRALVGNLTYGMCRCNMKGKHGARVIRGTAPGNERQGVISMANHESRIKRPPSRPWSHLRSKDTVGSQLAGERHILELIALGAPLPGILNRLCTALDVQIGNVISLVLLTGEANSSD